MAKKIRLGPFTEPQINEIKAKIDPLGHDYKIEIDQELVTKYQEQVANKNYADRYQEPTTPLGEFLFIEVDAESLLLIKKYLHDLGITLSDDAHFLPDNELYCPECDYTTTDLTLCKDHRLPLVDYFTKVQLEKNAAPKFTLTNMIIFAVLASVLVALIIENF